MLLCALLLMMAEGLSDLSVHAAMALSGDIFLEFEADAVAAASIAQALSKEL